MNEIATPRASRVTPKKTLNSPELKAHLQRLRRSDNWTNWLYLGRVYLIIALAVCAFLAFRQLQVEQGWHWAWNIPVYLLAVVVIGASQHQLAGATHEATHYMLFRNRLLNELTSDWLCMFPLFSSTYIFRLHHLAHHQFINDPERDPDFSQLRLSGHWLNFPVSKGRFLGLLFKQLSLFPLVRYLLVRAKYNAIGVTNNPYFDKQRSFSRWPMRLGVTYLLLLVGVMTWAMHANSSMVLLFFPLAGFLVVTACLLCVPGHRFMTTRLHPVISPKITLISRLAHASLLFTALGVIQYLTGFQALRYFYLLWVVPIFTTFSLFMILRQLVQHGNGDRGWLTNTRTFLVNPFIRYAVFPFGMDYHLPHHMYATIPHYRLPELHALLLEYPEYAEQGIVVEGYFFPHHWHASSATHPENGNQQQRRCPTVLEVLGPDYARSGDEVFIDESVLEEHIPSSPETKPRAEEIPARQSPKESEPAGAP